MSEDIVQSHGVEIHELRAIVAVWAAGSVSAAARALGVAQPTLTRTLKLAETKLGAALLARGPSGMELTTVGEILLPGIQRILAAHERAVDTARQLTGRGGGHVRIAISAVPRMTLLPSALERLTARYPDIHLGIEEAVFPAVLSDFEYAAIDFAVCPVPATGLPTGFDATRLLTVDLVVAMRADHPGRHCTALSDLLDLDWLAAGAQTGLLHPEAFTARRLVPPTCHVRCETLESALQMIARTDMVALVPKAVFDWALGRGLRQAPIHDPLPALTLGLITSRTQRLTPAADWLRDALVDLARSIDAT